jgi:steroid delta-isomerase-like uncharacterized protein
MPMEPIDVARDYFDAWNRRDPDAIVAAFADGGTCTDPLAGTLAGPAIGAYAACLFAAFPDLAFDIVGAALAGDGVIAAQWLMPGTNTGPFRGAPATGRSAALPGAAFIAVAGNSVRSVEGYFDSAATPRQLGLQVIVRPAQIGPFSFGASTRVHSGKTTKPGAFGVTVLEARSDEEVQEVLSRSRAIATEVLRMDGFISVVLAMVGRRMLTVSAWERPEDIAQLRDSSHRRRWRRSWGRRSPTSRRSASGRRITRRRNGYAAPPAVAWKSATGGSDSAAAAARRCPTCGPTGSPGARRGRRSAGHMRCRLVQSSASGEAGRAGWSPVRLARPRRRAR